MEIINLDNCEFSRKNGTYGGAAGNKDGVIYNGKYWLIKYPKNIMGLERTGEASYSTSPLSEFLGSHIFDILGYDVHETMLAARAGKIVVACKDFAIEDDLIEIRTIKNHANGELAQLLEEDFSSTGSDHVVALKELLLHLNNNTILKNVEGIKERFWEQSIVDIFINNNDRNNGNWGILRSRISEEKDRLAPIFDNGGSFQTKISEDKIEKLLKDPELLIRNASNIQTAYGVDGHALSATKFLNMYKDNKELESAIKKVVPIIKNNMDRIKSFIMEIPENYKFDDGRSVIVCSEQRKKVLLLQLQARLNNLLLPYYEEVLGKTEDAQILKTRHHGR
ncbi:MAG: CtkA family protein [Lachnospiraceae bacterium]|nr:CtkA family protein [Lachnospiraceae bacterium]